MAAETSQTLDRGLTVLAVLAESPQGLTVTELASRLAVARTVVYRLVVTLEKHGLVRRAQDGRCRLGLAVLTLARQMTPFVRDAAMPALRRLADSVAATSFLALVDGTDMMFIAVAEPARSDLHFSIQVGMRRPIELSAAGRAILAARTTGGRPLDPPWVTTRSETPRSAVFIAAPVLGVSGIEASVGVITTGDMSEADIGAAVARAAGETARALR